MVRIKVKKDTLAILVPVGVIIILGIVMANFDSLFPTPSASGKLDEIARRVNTNSSNTNYGTNPNASVTVLEFSDFECPACTMAVPEVHRLVLYYGDRINFVYKHFPAKQNSMQAAEAAECARNQGRFWEYHDMLFENQHSLGVSELQRYAKIMLINMDEFNKCFLGGQKTSKVEADFMEGIKLGIKGTPTFFINGIQLTGVQPFEEMKQIIDAELEKNGG